MKKSLAFPQDDNKSLDDRRAAIQAAWQAAQKPSLATVQAICDNWKTGGIIASYTPGVILLRFLGESRRPRGIETLKEALERTVPAHLVLDYAFRYLLIREVHEKMTLAQLAETPLNHFAGG